MALLSPGGAVLHPSSTGPCLLQPCATCSGAGSGDSLCHPQGCSRGEAQGLSYLLAPHRAAQPPPPHQCSAPAPRRALTGDKGPKINRAKTQAHVLSVGVLRLGTASTSRCLYRARCLAGGAGRERGTQQDLQGRGAQTQTETCPNPAGGSRELSPGQDMRTWGPSRDGEHHHGASLG